MSRTLMKPVNKNIGPRLKKLRTERNLSLGKLATELAQHVTIHLEGKSGETRILAIENSKNNLTPELAIAYSKYFDVSLEYIFCLSDDMQPENRTIKEVLGLEDSAIAKIAKIKKVSETQSETQLEILNFLIEHDFIKGLIESFDSFVYTTRSLSESKIISFDDRLTDDKQKEDAKIVELIPRWRLERSVSALIDKIADLMVNSEKIKYPDSQQSSPAISQ